MSEADWKALWTQNAQTASEAIRERDEAWAELEDIKLRLAAFGRDCVYHGDMTPIARIMLERILNGEK